MQRGLSIRFFSVMQMFAAFTTSPTALPHYRLRKIPRRAIRPPQDGTADGDDDVARALKILPQLSHLSYL